MSSSQYFRQPSIVGASARKAQPKRSLTNLQSGETAKHRHIRTREMKESCRAKLDARHRYILRLVADCLSIEMTEGEEAILDEKQVSFSYSNITILIKYTLKMPTHD